MDTTQETIVKVRHDLGFAKDGLTEAINNSDAMTGLVLRSIRQGLLSLISDLVECEAAYEGRVECKSH